LAIQYPPLGFTESMMIIGRQQQRPRTLAETLWGGFGQIEARRSPLPGRGQACPGHSIISLRGKIFGVAGTSPATTPLRIPCDRNPL
jgi:hypothetical protein